MTPQKMFDKVVRHLLTQNEPAVLDSKPHSTCVYHASNGNKCAVGCLIPDSKYTPEIEGEAVSSNRVDNILRDTINGFSDRHRQILADLQEIHDEFDPSEWRESLQECARLKKLKWRF